MTSTGNIPPLSPSDADSGTVTQTAMQSAAGEPASVLSRGELEERLHGMRTVLSETMQELGRIRADIESLHAAGVEVAAPVRRTPPDQNGTAVAHQQPADLPARDDTTQESLEQRFALLRRRLSDRMDDHREAGRSGDQPWQSTDIG